MSTYIEKASKKNEFVFFTIGDDALPAFLDGALAWSSHWWDGGVGDDAGHQSYARVAENLTREQRASILRLLRRAARRGMRRPSLPVKFSARDIARCERAFA